MENTNSVSLDTIHEDLNYVKDKIINIEKHMVDIDSIMTEDDYKAIEDYRQQKDKGELMSHNEVKKELGL